MLTHIEDDNHAKVFHELLGLGRPDQHEILPIAWRSNATHHFFEARKLGTFSLPNHFLRDASLVTNQDSIVPLKTKESEDSRH